MPSASAKKRAQNKKNAERNRARANQGLDQKSNAEISQEMAAQDAAKNALNEQEIIKQAAEMTLDEQKAAEATAIEKLRLEQSNEAAANRTVTGTLAKTEHTNNLHIHALSITYYGRILINDTSLELNSGHRYGVMGPNGCGKSSLLAVLGNREVPIPDSIDIFYLDHEMPPSDKTPFNCVVEVDEERKKLEAEVDYLQAHDPESEFLLELYERLDELDVDKAEATAARILKGLGFTKEMQHKKMKDFSGGWRMRVSLARALFIKPQLLLLDEPTNHLDLEACVWLEEELKDYKHILILVSHSQDFLNGVCSNIIAITQQKLEYYTGNYDQYEKTKSEVEEQQMKAYQWEQDQIAHMKNYIARFGHGSAKLAKQAQSKEKTLAKMVEKGLTEKVVGQKNVSFKFINTDKLAPPVIQVQNISFRYNESAPFIYRDLEFGLDQDSRLALVGPNGAGKSTLVKLILGDLEPTDGIIRRHSHCKMGHYHQHLAENLNMDLNPIEFMQHKFPHMKEIDQIRKMIGRYGITGIQQTMPIKKLSEGQRCRVALAWVAQQTPHMLLLDEPTNHLDMESIDALAQAIKAYNGGLVLVSHDFRLIGQVAEEIWICERQTVTKWERSIEDYKELLRKNVLGTDGKRKAMAAASADHYHKVEVPEAIKASAPKKTMQILGVSKNVKPGSPKPTNSPKTNGKLQNGNSRPAKNIHESMGKKDDWW